MIVIIKCMKRFFVWLASLAVVVLLIGCAGGGVSGGSGSTYQIYVDDTGNGRIVRMDDLSGANWTIKNEVSSKGGQFGTDSLDMAVDSQGRVFICDAENNMVYRFDSFTASNGTSFGTSGSGVGQFNSPGKIAIDSQDRIYVCDTDNHRIVRFDDMSGTNWVSIGSLGAGTNQFNTPFGLALDNQDRIYVADLSNHRIVRFDDMSGTNWTTFGSNGTGVGQFEFLADISITPTNKMLIVDRGGRVILTDLMSANNWVQFSEHTAQSAVMDGNGKIYVVNQNDYVLRRYDSMTDSNPDTFGSAGAGQGQFDSPSNILLAP